MIITPALDPRTKRPFEPSQRGVRKGTSWFGHETSPIISGDAVTHADEQRVKFFTAPHDASYEPGLTSHGLKGQSLVNDSGAFLRTVGAMPFSSWTGSPYYPDAPNSPGFEIMGYTTATHSPLGALNIYRTAQGVKRSYDIGDKKGFKLGLLDLGTSVAQEGLGIGYAGYRTATIGSVVQPHNPHWGQLSQSFGLAGNIGGSVLYAGAALSNLWSIDRNFMKKYQEKGGVEYMRRRLGLDFEALQEKALKDKTPEELEKAGMEHLKAFAKKNIELLRQRGFDPEVENEEEFIQKFLSPEEIREAGEIAFIDKLREKKTEKMSRAIGEEGVRALTRLFSEDREIDKAEVDKIVLVGLDKTNSWRYFRAGVYTVGIAAMILLCIFTAGTPLIVACVLYAAVALGEVIIAIQGLNQQSNMRDVAPGKNEKIVPYLGIAGTLIGVAVMITLASVFSMGIAPIALGLALAVVYLALYGYHLHTINQRREEHCRYLMEEKQGELSLEEFKYICTYMPDKELAFNSPLERLGQTNRKAIEEFMADPENRAKSWRDSLFYGLSRRQEQIEDEYTHEFWNRYQERIYLDQIAV
jgi:hypothetical protein